MTSRVRAASSTVRVIGPAASCVVLSGMIPARLTRPRVGRTPTRLFAEDGDRIDWPVSDPVPITPKLAAMAAPVPPLDPPGVRVKSYGFRVCPPSELGDCMANVRVALPLRMGDPNPGGKVSSR